MGLQQLSRNEIEPIDSFLTMYPTGSMQRTVRELGSVFRFSTMHKPNEWLLEGFLWVPNESDIRYDLDLSGALPQVEILKGSGDLSADIKKIKEELPHLCLTAGIREAAYLSQKTGGGGSGKHGYYLEVGVAKAKALQNFKDAVQDGIGSNDFVEYCIPRSFKMKYYK